MKHDNSGQCGHCLELINKYPNFHAEFLMWFQELQSKYPDAHISCAGRGRLDQEMLYQRKATRAHYGQSSHNYNCALDFWCNAEGKDLYDLDWFNSVLGVSVPDWLEWYGHYEYKNDPNKFYELPHVEVKNWRALIETSKILLVE